MIYSNKPGKPAENKLRTAYNTRINVGSTLKYSAMPQQTPPKTRLDERYNFFIFLVFLLFLLFVFSLQLVVLVLLLY